MSSYARQRYANKSVLRASYLGSQHDANRSPTRGVHGNGEDWDPMGPMGFPWEWE